MKKTLLLMFLTGLSLVGAVRAERKTLIDYFLPMEPQGPLVSEGIWGAPNVLPRDIKNGLEDPKLDNWCYWDGRIVKSDDGRYHIYASRWNQSFSHAQGWKEQSKAIHAVSDDIIGPYQGKRMIWPEWHDGLGHNVIGLRMHDGRYAVVASDRTPGDIFVSDSPDGPFEHFGEIQVDPNGFSMSLARYNKPPHHVSNVKILLRPDGRYMTVGCSTAPLLSEDGILGPYKIMGDRVYKSYPELPQTIFCELHEHPQTPSYMWRTAHHKLILTMNTPLTPDGYHADNVIAGELYELQQDPNEWYNLYDSERYGTVRKEMSGALLKHLTAFAIPGRG